MADEATTPEVAVNPQDTVKEPTMAEATETHESVPLAKFLDEKRTSKEALAERDEKIAELTAEIERRSATTNPVSSSDASVLAAELGLEPNVVDKILSAAESRIAPRFKQLEEKEKAQKAEQVFGQLFDKAIKENPEFSIANREVIKQLALNPRNANKTMPQIIEEAYGNAFQGRKTMETGTNAAPETTNNFAELTENELDELLSTPTGKKQYEEFLVKGLL